ncbi:MAG: iron-containing alcohol dehydrogenase [Candidatus Omnitrophica bacterium]|nr:iron-containing alcohol dehydrogenase [Candidatus Omnitrophota bacterium]
MIKFESTTKLILSDNLASDIGAIVRDEMPKNITVILDANIAGQESVVKMLEAIETIAAVKAVTVKSAEPTTDMVNEYAGKLRKVKTGLYIGIGGGSVLDLTKALSVMTVNAGKVEEYHGTGKIFTSGVKKMMVPTTAGTGSEVTGGAVLVNERTKFKRGIGGKYVIPDYAILDASLTATMPDSITASTGMDAIGHAVESYTARCANDITRIYSKEAFRLVYNNLPKVLNDRQNMDLRRKVLLGSTLAGIAIANSNTGACHSISYAMGLYHNIPHGLAVAYLLPAVVKINMEKGCNLYADLYDLIDVADKGLSIRMKAERFSSDLSVYGPLSCLTKKFSDYGVTEKNRGFIAKRGLDLTPALSNNPVEFGLEEALRVLREV